MPPLPRKPGTPVMPWNMKTVLTVQFCQLLQKCFNKNVSYHRQRCDNLYSFIPIPFIWFVSSTFITTFLSQIFHSFFQIHNNVYQADSLCLRQARAVLGSPRRPFGPVPPGARRGPSVLVAPARHDSLFFLEPPEQSMDWVKMVDIHSWFRHRLWVCVFHNCYTGFISLKLILLSTILVTFACHLFWTCIVNFFLSMLHLQYRTSKQIKMSTIN